MSLNGYNIEDAKILHLGGQPLNAPEGEYICADMVLGKNVMRIFKPVMVYFISIQFTGYQNNLKVLYSQAITPASLKKTRYICSTPDRILDAPELRNDFCKFSLKIVNIDQLYGYICLDTIDVLPALSFMQKSPTLRHV